MSQPEGTPPGITLRALELPALQTGAAPGEDRVNWKHVYGPVPSRRLGRSLGVNPIPSKTCNYNCAYCQLGHTTLRTDERQRFYPPSAILREVSQAVEADTGQLDFVTYVGEGEPTLCRDLGYLVTETKRLVQAPVATITNGSLLHRRDVRDDLSACDVVVPSLDSVEEKAFRRINRPGRDLRVDQVVEGLITFSDSFTGELWVEIMLVQGVNDGEEHLLQLRQVLDRVSPDRIYLNVPIRPPAESWVQPPDAEGLVRAQSLLGKVITIDMREEGDFGTEGFDDPLEAIQMIVRRHPMRVEQIAAVMEGGEGSELAGQLEELVDSGRLRALEYRGQIFYAAGEGRHDPRSLAASPAD